MSEIRKNLTELVFILDRSGSMAGLESDTIGGYNGFISRQKEEDKLVNLTTVLFNNKINTIHDRVNIQKVDLLTKEDYFASGTTSLLDAIGQTISKISDQILNDPEETRPGKVMFVITTDGMENSSIEFTKARVKQKIEFLTKLLGWEFIFLGANIDAVYEAESIGIKSDRVSNYINDEKGIGLNFAAMDSVVASYSSNRKISKKWSKDIESHYKEKNNKKF